MEGERAFLRNEPIEKKAEPAKEEDKVKSGYNIRTMDQAIPKAKSIPEILNSKRLLCSGQLESVFLSLRT